MEPKNLQFLSCLRENSREKLTEISKQTKIPISTLFDMLKEMQGSVITKNTVLLNFHKLGFKVHAQIFLKVNPESKEKIRNHLLFNQNVNNLYKINNEWDFVVETLHKNIRELDGFLDALNSKFRIEKHQIHYLVDEIK